MTALRSLLSIPSTKDEERAFIETAQQSVGRVLTLRDVLRQFFDGAKRPAMDLSPYPLEFHDAIRAAMQHQCILIGVSDALEIAVPLAGNDDNCRAMNGVELAILSICGMAALTFSRGLVFRGGLDIGVAVQIEPNEVYGAALAKAYQLETMVAEYPRFVVGDELLDFIQEIEKQPPQTVFGRVAQHDAKSCRRMIVQDVDGRQMLDFLGEEVKTTLGANIPAECVSKGHDFVCGEYEKFRKWGPRYSRRAAFACVNTIVCKKLWGV